MSLPGGDQKRNSNLNIQENLIVHNDADEDEDSERYTFGCVTPKGED